MAHYERYAAFRDTALKQLPDGRKVAAYVVVVIDDQGDIHAGASNAKQCLPELRKIIEYYQPKPTR